MKGKKKFWTLLMALIFTLTLGVQLTAHAESKNIGVGVTYIEGDTVVIPSDYTWFVNDDWTLENDYLKAGSYAVTEVSVLHPSNYQGYAIVDGPWWDQIFITKPAGRLADDPIGFQVVSGDGTEDNPYAFELIYDLSAPTTFAVYFNSGGAPGVKDPVTGVTGSYTLPSNTFSWTGYVFTGWKVNNTGALLQPGDSINVTENVTLYAQWEQSEYSLEVSHGTATFNGVTGSTLTGLHYGDVVSITAAEPDPGQVFDQWNTDHGGSFGNRYEATTTYTMPARDGSIWVRYKDAIETCSHHDGEIVCYAWDGNAPLPDTAGNYFLTQDVTLTSAWEVPAGTTTLCLHNHKITMAGNGPAIHVGSGATLLLLASNQIWDERNTLQHAAGASGCGVQVDGGSFTLEIARILNNNGGGIVVNSGSAKIGYRCHIGGNGSADSLGGGVIINGGSVVMDDTGKITGNTALAGGGVYIAGGSFTASLGEITQNTAQFGGDVCVADGSFRIYNWPTIGSVYLASGKTIGVTGQLRFTAPITVATQDRNRAITSGLSRYGSADLFAPADENHIVTASGDGEAFLMLIPPAYGEPDFILPASLTAISENAFEGNASMTVTYVPDGCASIGNAAFKDCVQLSQIRLPKNCAFGNDPFDGCVNLLAIYGPADGTTQQWAISHNIPFVSE